MKRLHSSDVLQAIAERAYVIAEERGFAPGQETENWIVAEREVLGDLLERQSGDVPTNGGSNGGSNGGPAPRKLGALARLRAQNN